MSFNECCYNVTMDQIPQVVFYVKGNNNAATEMTGKM